MRNGVENNKAKTRWPEVEPSSGNVFEDLGFPNPEEALLKAELAVRILEIVTGRKLTQKKAAVVLGIDQPKVSALLRGKLAGFSIERLLRFLNALGQDVDIVIRPARNDHASTRVVSEPALTASSSTRSPPSAPRR
jgi:predicted XRE-type DNA-binding protein